MAQHNAAIQMPTGYMKNLKDKKDVGAIYLSFSSVVVESSGVSADRAVDQMSFWGSD